MDYQLRPAWKKPNPNLESLASWVHWVESKYDEREVDFRPGSLDRMLASTDFDGAASSSYPAGDRLGEDLFHISQHPVHGYLARFPSAQLEAKDRPDNEAPEIKWEKHKADFLAVQKQAEEEELQRGREAWDRVRKNIANLLKLGDRRVSPALKKSRQRAAQNRKWSRRPVQKPAISQKSPAEQKTPAELMAEINVLNEQLVENTKQLNAAFEELCKSTGLGELGQLVLPESSLKELNRLKLLDKESLDKGLPAKELLNKELLNKDNETDQDN